MKGDPKMHHMPGSTFHSNIVSACLRFCSVLQQVLGKSYSMVVFVVTSISASGTTSCSILNYQVDEEWGGTLWPDIGLSYN